ncbi:hypothetical protein E4P35_14665 [Thiopseudomonas sp. 4R-3cl]|nr:hypothetical protein E4P35_14665 [Thiopseudomonas sp. 4R-3cl]
MTEHPISAPPSGRRTGARTAGWPRALRGGETGAVTAEYAVLLPVIAFVLVSVLLAGDDASLSHTVEGGWVTVEVVQPGPGPLAWAEVLTLTAHAAAPDQRPGTPAASPEDRS